MSTSPQRKNSLSSGQSRDVQCGHLVALPRDMMVQKEALVRVFREGPIEGCFQVDVQTFYWHLKLPVSLATRFWCLLSSGDTPPTFSLVAWPCRPAKVSRPRQGHKDSTSGCATGPVPGSPEIQ